ncbi:putative short chain dehydrogenase/ reductase [Teratosphaeria nubilosa]|uniref:Putative short chain dehydrogenase/ reductase n=1 Tax=Teratosphaeria nubilosa TaxID=161662 RepID=A0A6G1L6T0_9PEZI|nr:putative short chain dehydrogenase/ reductase [Teratosphaeria nubilosa]
MKGKVCCVTGAASGIGQATAVRLAELGVAGLALSDLDLNGLQETKNLCSQHSAKIRTDKVNVGDSSQVAEWIQHIIDDFGRLDSAANVAGIAGGSSEITQDIDIAAWDRMLAINLSGVMNCMRAELKHIMRPGGAIVNVSSTSGLRGLPGNAAYASSKFGVIGLTESTAAEYGKKGVRVNAVLPGPIDTKIFRDGEAKGLFDSKIVSAGTLMGRMGEAREAACVIAFLLSDEASFVTGARWTVDGGYSACGFYSAG